MTRNYGHHLNIIAANVLVDILYIVLPITSVVARDNLTRAQCHIELRNILRIKKQYQQAFEQTSKLEEIIGVMKSEERTEKNFLDILIL